LAALFHAFYTECRVLGEEAELSQARLALTDAARIVLRNTLTLLGVTAPERM
jgi:arginyl-tRNA synthetase